MDKLSAAINADNLYIDSPLIFREDFTMAKIHNGLMVICAVGGMVFGGAVMAGDPVSKEEKAQSKAEYSENVKKAEADYKVAKERCDAMKGNEKDVCIKDAKATEKKAKAEAKAQRKTVAAHANAGEDKREADYKAAKERCDALSGNAKDSCVADAKARFQQ